MRWSLPAEAARANDHCINRSRASQQEEANHRIYRSAPLCAPVGARRHSSVTQTQAITEYHQPAMTTTMLRPPALAPFLLLLFVLVQGHRFDLEQEDSVGSKQDLCLSVATDHDSTLVFSPKASFFYPTIPFLSCFQ